MLIAKARLWKKRRSGWKYKCKFISTGKTLWIYCFRDNFPELQGGTRELSKIFFDKISVIEIENMVFDLYNLTKEEKQL